MNLRIYPLQLELKPFTFHALKQAKWRYSATNGGCISGLTWLEATANGQVFHRLIRNFMLQVRMVGFHGVYLKIHTDHGA
jgi:hypothetical protein